MLNLHVLLNARQRFLEDHAFCYDGDITGSIYDKYALLVLRFGLFMQVIL